MSRRVKSSFCGIINEIPFIRVDEFTNWSGRAYFLSHYHSDHIVGLYDSALHEELEKNNACIYASEVTIAIIKNAQVEKLLPFLRVLKLGRNTLTINKDGHDIILCVTALPAGHSAGSVMFLFEYENKTVLFTGDFRITPNDIRKYTHLHESSGEPINIDALYIDTTFQMVPSFPRRSEVIRNVVDRVKQWLSVDKDNVVHLKTSANFGYEVLANAIYDAIKIKTYVGEHKWNIFRQFPKEMYGITNDRNSRIFLGYKKGDEIFTEKTKDQRKILSIRFSAMRWANETNIDENFIELKRDNELDVCFATHCGRDELIYLVNYFNPTKVVGFPDQLIRNSPVKMAPESPLKIQISKGRKRLREFEKGDEVVSKRLSKDDEKRMFDW